ncbi:MAG TPA: hypothetical protein VFW65_03600 [Pseudonocardiaceae bacterium]|nr:hypothetical protein [Pseudonocardiaceae bacterium]
MTDLHWLVRALLTLYPNDYRARYGAEMLAVSQERAGRRRWPGVADVADLLGGAARVRLTRVRATGRDERMRDGLAVVGVVAPVALLAGLADQLHEVAWYVWYGGFEGVSLRDVVGPAPVWLVWAVVAGCAVLGLRRVAAAVAWLAVAVMVGAPVVGLATAEVAMGGWLSLGLVAAVALTFAPRSGWAVVGGWRLSGVAGGVGLVLVTRVLGHHWWPTDLVAWFALGAALVAACRPRTAAGRRALLMLVAPAVSAVAGYAAVQLSVVDVYLLPWPLAVVLFQGVPLVVATAVLALRPPADGPVEVNT